MSILSQIGVIFLIIFIVLVLIRSNRQLVEAAEEGEHFVDEWALREIRRQELLASQELPAQKTTDPIPDNVVPIHREPDVRTTWEPDVRITFVELDESRRQVRRIPVRQLPFTIGRDPANDLVIDNLTVAKRHCRIVQREHLVVMEDIGSRNKLAVGGTVAEQTVLKDHLCIGIGEKEFLVEMVPLEKRYPEETLRTGEVL